MEKTITIVIAVIIAGLAHAYTNPLQKAVASGEETLDPAELADHDAIEKTGEGTLVLPDISSFSGDIVVKAGKVKTSVAGGLGDTAGKTVVEAGAQLYIDSPSSDIDFSGETMEIASSGSSIAIYVNNKGANENNLGPLTLTGDARVYFKAEYHFNKSKTCDLNGHKLTFQSSGNGIYLWLHGTYTAGDIAAESIRCFLRGGATFQGGAGNSFSLGSYAIASFFQYTGSMPWTLKPDADGANLEIRYQDGRDGMRNIWAGPIDLSSYGLVLTRGWGDTLNGTCGMTLSGKISGKNGLRTGGSAYQNFTAFITNPGNDFEGGVTFTDSTLNLPVSGALPADGGELVMKGGSVVLTNELAYALPSATFDGTGVVNGVSATGTWKTRLAKTGDGTLLYNTCIGAPVLDLRGGTFTMPVAKVTTVTNRVAGLNGGSRTFDNNTDAANFYASGVCITNSTVDRPTMAYKCGTGDGWTANTAYTYDGFIWNRNLTNETWRFVVCMTTKGKILVDGSLVVECGSAANSTASYGGAKMGTVEVEPGPHRIEMRMYVTSVGSSTSSGGGAYQNNKADWIANCGFTWGQRRGMMMDRLGRDGRTYNDFDYIVDAGDGNLLTLTDDEDTVIHHIPSFDTIVATNGVAVLDMNGNDYAVKNLVGCPTVANCGKFSVTNDWRLTSSGTAAFDGKVEFAEGATLTIDAIMTPSAESEWTILTAVGGVTGLPAIVPGSSSGTWMLRQDGTSLKLSYRPQGLQIIFR